MQTKRKNPEVIRWANALAAQAGSTDSAKSLAKLLDLPRRKMREINLDALDAMAKDNDNIVVPGKILANGNVTKKYSVAALKISKQAEAKLKQAGCSVVDIEEMLKKNTLKIVR
ncbi:MAG: 50S ribosomal protein L18e [Candidatus Micrarchaeia archaeon]